ncbi:MAG: hypothetical protein ABIO40_05315 [Devosia sp.]
MTNSSSRLPNRGKRRWRRSVALAWHRATRRLGLSQRFLIAALLTVALSTGLLGLWAGTIVKSNILYGVAETANSSLQSVIYPSVQGLAVDRELSDAERAELDATFAFSSRSDATRLIQFALLRPDGTEIYVADAGLKDNIGLDLIARARQGELVASLVTVEPEPVGPYSGIGLTVLRILAPVSTLEGRPFLVAVLYLSARSLTDVVAQSQREIWALVVAIGGIVVVALYLMVDRAGRTISLQRARLAANLKTSRLLADENRVLREASELLRLEASKANESLLARVGSDIHDGPVQLLTLLVLRLSGSGPPTLDADAAAALAKSAMEELRNISSGLVLPELAELSIASAIGLAASRHERMTGTRARLRIRGLDHHAPMAVKICAYRVVQESLNNNFQHGGLHPTVIAFEADDRVDLSISAISPVAPPLASSPRERLGLVGMRLRVEALGGSIRVGLNAKARVRVRIPLTLAATGPSQALQSAAVQDPAAAPPAPHRADSAL